MNAVDGIDDSGAEKAGASAATVTLGANTVKAALDAMEARGDLTPEQNATIMWFFCYVKDLGLSLSKAGELIGSSSTTVYRVFSGKYGASVDHVCAEIVRFRKLADERAKKVDVGFVETSTWRTIDKVCNAALISQTVAFIFGQSQIGKTTSLEEYARRNNHGQTKLVRMPASAGVNMFMRELAKVCHVSTNNTFAGMCEAVMNTIDDKNVLIIDELHQVFTSYQEKSAIKTLEKIREVHDRCKCGLVLCGTMVLQKELQEGKMALLLEQLKRRGTIKVVLPPMPTRGDLDKIARKFGLDPALGEALEVVKEMLHSSGLGMYMKFLQAAAQMANRQGKKTTWDHFVQAYDVINRLSQRGEA